MPTKVTVQNAQDYKDPFTFDDLKIGTIFKYRGELCIKITPVMNLGQCTINAISLLTGKQCVFDNIPIKALESVDIKTTEIKQETFEDLAFGDCFQANGSFFRKISPIIVCTKKDTDKYNINAISLEHSVLSRFNSDCPVKKINEIEIKIIS
jgi:hypothetical protein